MQQLQTTIYKLMIPMIIVLPLWLVVGRALLGSLGWMTILMIMTVLPILTVLQIVFAVLVMRRPDVRATKQVSPRDARYLSIFYGSIFLFGLFLVDGGDAEDSINSVATNLVGQWFESISNLLASLFLLVAVVMTFVCLGWFIKERTIAARVNTTVTKSASA